MKDVKKDRKLDEFFGKYNQERKKEVSAKSAKRMDDSIIKYLKTGNNEIFLRKIGEEIKIKKKTSLLI